jgi:hypothetical protein
MATKKQKREAALVKRAEFDAQVKAEGLKALEHDRAYRAAQTSVYTPSNEQVDPHHSKIVETAAASASVSAYEFTKTFFIGGGFGE